MLDEPKQFTLSESQPQKLTNWKNEPDIQSLKYDLDSAKPSHTSQMIKIQGWNDLMYIQGKAKPPKVRGHSSVQPKLVRRQAEWRYSALTEPFLGSNKIFLVRPVTWEDAEGARQNELVLNWQFRTKINRIKFIDDFVRTTVDEGTCIIRVGWVRNTVMVKKTVPVYEHVQIDNDQDFQKFQQAFQLKQENPRGFNDQVDDATKASISLFEEQEIPTIAREVGTEEIEEEKILENRPTVEVLNPNNVFIDPSCMGDLQKALFVVYSFETSRADLKKNGTRYKNLDKVDWNSNAPITHPDHETTTPTEFQFKDAARKKVVAYEYWGFYDIHGDGKLVPIVATWIGIVMIRMEVSPFPDQKLPFVISRYLPVKRELYGEPDAELLEDNQKIIGAVVRGAIDLMGRSANGQRGFQKGMLDPLNRRRYDNGQDYEFNPAVNPLQGMIEHKYPELPQSVMLMMGMQNHEAEALTGVKSFSGGISGESYGDVATGAKGAMDAASKREMAILRRLAKAMSEIGTKIMAMNGEFLSETEVIRVTNDEFVEINRDDLAGNYDLEVDIATAEVDNAKSQDLAFMLQTLGPNMAPEMYMMLLSEIALLKRMPDLAKKLRDWKPQPNPLAMQKAQLENAKLEAETQKLQADAQTAQLEAAKIQKELAVMDSTISLNNAKAQEAMARKDKTDLDFIEQETGTTHERDMQKQRAQSQGNQNLAVTKALVKPVKQDEKEPDLEAALGFNAISGRLAEASDTRASALPPVGPGNFPPPHVPVQQIPPVPLIDPKLGLSTL